MNRKIFLGLFALVLGVTALVVADSASTARWNPWAPTAPNSLSACERTAWHGTYVNLTWNDRSYNEAGFKIYRSSNGTNYSFIGSVSANQESFTDWNASRGSYYYKVAAYNSYGANYSSAVTTSTCR